MRMMMNGVGRLVLLAMTAVIATALGCAQQVGDIDRVQANALRKSDFLDGEWYVRQTVSEVPPAAFAGFIGLTGEMEKIRWEITEDYLIGYRSYEHNPGSRRLEAENGPDGEPVYRPGEEEGYTDEFKESPIVAYPILSHFDVQRQYNSSTGEQTNVIVENSSDRLWYEREWFRVDWVNDLETNQMFDPYFTASLNFYVQPSEGSADSLQMEYFDPNANVPGIDSDDYADGDLYYMDFTNRVLLDPDYSYCYGLWYPMGLDDCAASEIEIRTSLLRVPANSDYELIFYDDLDQQKFGYFRTERLVYDDYFGERLSNQILLGNRYNIWSDTWQRDGSGNILTDAEGRALPRAFADRTPRPVVYHVSPNYPEALWPATHAIADDYDRAFRRSVAAAQQVPFDQTPRMFFACHNPVLQEDPVECGDIGLLARVGDLRYNFIYWIDAPQASGPLGYGPSNADPETGEIIAGQAFIYGAAVDTYAQYGLDLIRFLNGDLELEDLRDAEYIRADILARNDPNIDPRGMLSAELADVRIEDLNIREFLPETGRQFVDHVREFGLNDFVARPEWINHRFDMIAESGAGALAVDDELLRGFGVSDLSELPDEIRDRYFRGGVLLPRILTEGRTRRMEAARQSIYLAENLDDTILGLAMQYRGRTDYEQIRQEIRSEIYRGVQTHEVGHTVGLRHNFQGSYDSLNYFDRYWELKTEGVLGVTSSGDIGVIPFRSPQYLVDIYGMAQTTPAQIEGRMREYQYSSIMDYHSAFNSDWHGLGKYDDAAIIYAYTSGRDRTVRDFDPSHPLFNTQERGYVEVFNNVGDARDIFNSMEGLDNPAYPELLEVYHYSTVATEMATDGGVYPSDSRVAAQTIRDRIRDRSLVRYSEVLNQREADVANRPIEVPYLFLSDYWVGASQTARTWDQGADPLEQALNIIERYRTYYPFTYFRRDRLDWSQYDILDRLAGNYFMDLIDNYQRWLFDVAIQGGRPDAVIDNGWTFAAYASLNLLAEVMTTPSYGSYVLDSEDNTYYLTSYGERSDANLYLAPGQGRRPYSRYDVDMGYNYWVYPTEAGHFWAYYAAAIMMTSSTSLAVRGADVDADFLTYSIPPYLIFEEEMTRLFNGLWLEDNNSVAPTVVRASDGSMQLERRLFAPIPLQGGDYLDPETGFTTAAMMDSRIDVENGPSVDVMNGFTYEYLPLLYGMAFFDSNFSLHYHDQARIFRLGSGETLTAGEGFEVVQFCDPIAVGGVCYAALTEEGTDDPGAAARLILETQELYDEYVRTGEGSWLVENNVEKMNMMRGLFDLFANPWD